MRTAFPRLALAAAAAITVAALAASPAADAISPGPAGAATHAGLRIHDLQGAAQVSPYAGKTVSDIPGVVTAVGAKQLWVQDPRPDHDPATSEGIVVYTGSKPAAVVGDAVSVNGTVKEHRPGSVDSTNLATTELENTTVSVTAHGQPLPRPVRIGPSGRMPPSTVIDRGDNGDIELSHHFDPRRNGVDFWESMEGMRVEIDQAQVVGPTNSFGETSVVPIGSSIRTTRGGIVARANDFNPERVVLAPTLASIPTANVGDSYSGATVGVLDYNFGNYEILPTTTPILHKGNLQRQVTRGQRAGELAVATFNVENLAPEDPQSKFDTLGQYATHNLASPDILALEEIQDNNGATDDGVVAADQTLQKLVDAIKAAGGPSYRWAEIDPTNDADGGEPGGNIRVAFLYRTDRGLQFVSRGHGDATAATMVTTDSQHQPALSLSPGRIAPSDAAWTDSRKPLAGQFTFRGRTVFVIANHFDSKGGDDPLFGRYQPIKEPSAVQRHEQATLVRDFVAQIERIDRRADVLVVGDLNDFDFSDTTSILTAGRQLVDLPSTLPTTQRYTYVYEGNSEVLDHILLSPALADPRHGYDYQVVHLNSEFADQISDHDPQIVRLELPGR
ncbi:MAG TPA: endonuclease/exonuclease/phosphatase family protein [Mycobacteriales bacterium]|nr:endonuclease/exonuclease/phosphatase family protein [Mycobacteriales bacterium]